MIMNKNSLGQLCVLHEVEPVDDPRLLQSLPPYAGDGFVQDRDRDFVPLPHDFEQLPHADQEVYPPLTIMICKTIVFLRTIL